MKNRFLFFFFFACSILKAPAQEAPKAKKTTGDTETYHKLNFCFTWFELGSTIPIKEKKMQDLPYGLNTYLYSPKSEMAVGLWGVGLYYKNHWGLSAIFVSQEFSVPDEDFKNYVASQYPDYFLPTWVQGHTYTLNNINYRLSYRFHKGRIVYEPQFQLGINDCEEFDTHFVLKQNGSNNFVEYGITTENTKKNQFSYRAAIVARWRFSKPDWNWNIEPGLRFEFSVVPTNYNYIITTTPYNMPSTEQVVNVKQLRPAIAITAVVSVFRK